MDFLKHKYWFLIISLVIIVGGITYGLLTGYKFDIDFKGGTSIQVELNQEFDNSDVQDIVKNVINEVPLVQKVTGGNNAVSITTGTIPMEEVDSIVNKLQEKYSNMGQASTKNVQPNYGKELINSALIAIVVSVVIVLIYITIRFKTLGFSAAITAIIGLVHDATFLIALYGIFKLPINSTFVAVILTIIGYSINDTIIIYDRIRENRKKVSLSKNLKETINISLSQTIKRTIYTSLTTIMAIGVVYVFAVIYNQQVLKEFSLPLMIGILVGTYSSMFISTSLWYLLETKIRNKRMSK